MKHYSTGRLSTGLLYKSVPKDLKTNLEFRAWLIRRGSANRRTRQALVEACRNDILFWINAFALQYNPNAIGDALTIGPFITWPIQDRVFLDRPDQDDQRPPARQPAGLLYVYEQRKTAVVEKSRDMGATWNFCLFETWLAGFFSGVEALNVSRSEDAVDDGTRQCLFEKMRFIIKHCPEWLLGEVEDTKLFLGFRNTGSEITGQASTGQAFTGGRGSVVFVDEYAVIKDDVRLRENTASISNCRFFNSTHLGVGTEFYKMTTEDGIYLIRHLHWTRHPQKNQGLYSFDVASNQRIYWKYDEKDDEIVESVNTYPYRPNFFFVESGAPTGGPAPGIRSPWYDAKSVDIGSERGVAIELDMDPKGSSTRLFPPVMVAHYKRDFGEDAWWTGNIDTTGSVPILVEKDGGPLRLWCGLEDGKPPPARYAISCDVASGVGATPSCLSIVNRHTGEKVGEFAASNVFIHHFAPLVLGLTKLFVTHHGFGPTLIWEKNGPGVTFGRLICESGYSNLYLGVNVDRKDRKKETVYGWHSNRENKQALLEGYRDAMEKRLFRNHSKEAIDELSSFEFTNSGEIVHAKEKKAPKDDPSGARSNHADRVITDAMAWEVIKNDVKQHAREEKKEDVTPAQLSRWWGTHQEQPHDSLVWD